MNLPEAVASSLTLIRSSFVSYKTPEGAIASWVLILQGIEPPKRVLAATLRLCSEARQFAPTPGEVLLEALADNQPSLRLSAGEAYELAGPESPMSVAKLLAIECGALQPAQFGTWTRPADPIGAQVCRKRFGESWDQVSRSGELAKSTLLRLQTRQAKQLERPSPIAEFLTGSKPLSPSDAPRLDRSAPTET